MVVNAANLVEAAASADESKKSKNLQLVGQKKETGAVRGTRAADFIKEQRTQADGVDATYEKPTKEAMQDVLDETMGSMDAKQRKDQMAVLSNTMTPEDYAKAQEDGFSASKTDSAAMVTEIDKIKMTLAKAGKDITCFGDAPDMEAIQSYLGDTGLARQVAEAMQQSDLPATQENLKEIKETIEQAQTLKNMDAGAVKYMLDNALEPTVQNLYVAENSGSTYYQPMQKMPQNISGLEDSIRQVIQGAGLQDTAKTRADAQWMVENGIALTSENLSYMEQLKELALPKQQEEIAAAAVQALAEGQRAQDAMLIPAYTLEAKAEDAVAVVYAATEEDIRYLIRNQQEVNLKNLKMAHHLQKEDSQTQEKNTDASQIFSKNTKPQEDGRTEKEVAVEQEPGQAKPEAAAQQETGQAKPEAAAQQEPGQAKPEATAQQEKVLLAGGAFEEAILQGTEDETMQKSKSLSQMQTAGNNFAQEVVRPQTNRAKDGEAVGQESAEKTAQFDKTEPENSASVRREIAADRADTVQTEALQVIVARRQLAEVRLRMTVEANYSLLKQGISLDTKPLAELVDTLQQMEEQYYRSLLKEHGVEANEENVTVFRKTTEYVEQLKTVPAYTLGRVTIWEEAQSGTSSVQGQPLQENVGQADTLRTVTEKGLALQAELNRAGERYETMQTQVRADLGDSMKKAFQNVDSILQELDLEPTKANARAVRILGYNHLEITADSVQQMKAADQQVQNVLEEMKPAVVLHFIRKGVNPLDMDFVTLHDEAMQTQEELGDTGEERFSKFLYQLERKDGITDEERESYIGIYRLLHQVEQTDGAVIGALVHQGLPLTMRNLMTGVRSMKHSGREYQVDDTSEQVRYQADGTSITEQIEAGYQTGCLRTVTRKMTPDKMEQLQKNGDWLNQTPEEVQEQMVQMEAEQGEEAHEQAWEYEKQQLTRCMEAAQAPEEVYEFLSEYGLPNTAEHVLAAQQMMKKRNTYQTLLEETVKGDASKLEALKEKILAQFGDASDTPTEWNKAQQNLAESAQQAMEAMLERDDVTHLDLQNLQMVTAQLQLASHMAKEERYEIPVQMGDEITNISVKIVRNKEQKGKVGLYFETDQLGKVSAQFDALGEEIRGYIATERRESAQILEQNKEALKEAVSADAAVELSVLTAKPGKLSAFSLEELTATKDWENSEMEDASVQTRALYGMAERVIRCLSEL